MMIMVMIMMMMMGKEKQKEKKKERQSLYTLTPDHPPLRPEYIINNVAEVVKVLRPLRL